MSGNIKKLEQAVCCSSSLELSDNNVVHNSTTNRYFVQKNGCVEVVKIEERGRRVLRVIVI